MIYKISVQLIPSKIIKMDSEQLKIKDQWEVFFKSNEELNIINHGINNNVLQINEIEKSIINNIEMEDTKLNILGENNLNKINVELNLERTKTIPISIKRQNKKNSEKEDEIMK